MADNVDYNITVLLGDKTYVYPAGLPVVYQNYGLEKQERDKMVVAIGSFISAAVNGTSLSAKHFDQVVDYLTYYINAPAWWGVQTEEVKLAVERLRSQVESIQDMADIDQFIKDCLEIGLDPL